MLQCIEVFLHFLNIKRNLKSRRENDETALLLWLEQVTGSNREPKQALYYAYAKRVLWVKCRGSLKKKMGKKLV